MGGSISGVEAHEDLTVTGSIQFQVAGSYSFKDSSVASFSNTSGGNITIEVDNTTITYPPTDPTITIVQAPRTLTLTGLQANSEVRIYEANTVTEIAGTENSGTTFADSTISVNTVDIVIHNIAYEHIRISGANTVSNLELPVQQRFDRSYSNE